jgi:CheY-like chemotaxis protein
MNPSERTEIILAEDDDDDFELFASAAREVLPVVVIHRAENGIVLIQVLEEKIPDMLFMDVLLPGKSGLQCLREIRANKKFDHLPVIIYSSINELRHIEFCYRYGSNFYVHKPNSFSDLKEILQKIFSIDWKKMNYYPDKGSFVVNP